MHLDDTSQLHTHEEIWDNNWSAFAAYEQWQFVGIPHHMPKNLVKGFP